MLNRIFAYRQVLFLITTVILLLGLTSITTAEEANPCPTQDELKKGLHFDAAEMAVKKISDKLNKMSKIELNELKNLVNERDTKAKLEEDWSLNEKRMGALWNEREQAEKVKDPAQKKRIKQYIISGHKNADEQRKMVVKLNEQIRNKLQKLLIAAGFEARVKRSGDPSFRFDSNDFRLSVSRNDSGDLSLLVYWEVEDYELPHQELDFQQQKKYGAVRQGEIVIAENGEIISKNVSLVSYTLVGDEKRYVGGQKVSYDELAQTEFLKRCQALNPASKTEMYPGAAGSIQ
jgi:hypothetical protein